MQLVRCALTISPLQLIDESSVCATRCGDQMSGTKRLDQISWRL